MRLLIAILVTCWAALLPGTESEPGVEEPIVPETIFVGDQAPPLEGLTWVKGEPVTSYGDKITVVEFWGTQCSRCKENYPVLSALQRQYKDKISIVGLSTDPIEDIQSFMENEHGEAMEYSVAGAADRWASTYWARVRGNSLIIEYPYAFIIDQKGILLWHGYSPQLGDELPKVFSGRLSAEWATSLRAAHNGAMMAIRQRDHASLMKYIKEILMLDPTDENVLGGLRSQSMQTGDVEGFRTTLSEIIANIKYPDQKLQLAGNLLQSPTSVYRALDLSIPLARSAHEELPDNSFAARLQAYAQSLVGDIDGAITTLESFLERNPDDQEAKRSLGYYQHAAQVAASLTK